MDHAAAEETRSRETAAPLWPGGPVDGAAAGAAGAVVSAGGVGCPPPQPAAPIANSTPTKRRPKRFAYMVAVTQSLPMRARSADRHACASGKIFLA